MLIECPECERKVSDRAKACPDCGFPVAEEVQKAKAQDAADAAKKTRKLAGEVDCPFCAARGFSMFTPEEGGAQHFKWCTQCARSGRLTLVESSEGYFAVALASADAFVRGDDVPETEFAALGTNRPEGFRYPEASPRVERAGVEAEVVTEDAKPAPDDE